MPTIRTAVVAAQETEVRISERAFDRLSRARREGETLSDVILRLSAATLEGLQRRGELDVTTADGRRLTIAVDQQKCLGAMSCVALAPSVFAYDMTQKGTWRKQSVPLGMMEPEEGEVESSALLMAAESCPYRSITIRDAKSGKIEVQ